MCSRVLVQFGLIIINDPIVWMSRFFALTGLYVDNFDRKVRHTGNTLEVFPFTGVSKF